MGEFEESDREEVSIEDAEETLTFNSASPEPAGKKRRVGKYEIPIDMDTAKSNYARAGDEIDEDAYEMLITGPKYKREDFVQLIATKRKHAKMI
jgi:hypothetical protein